MWECLFHSKNNAQVCYRKEAPKGQKNCFEVCSDHKAPKGRPKIKNFFICLLASFQYLLVVRKSDAVFSDLQPCSHILAKTVTVSQFSLQNSHLPMQCWTPTKQRTTRQSKRTILFGYNLTNHFQL